MKNLLVIALVSILMLACGKRNASLSQRILGKWEIESTTDIDKDQKKYSDSWIKFHTNNTFDSVSELFNVTKGEWKVDSEEHTLQLKDSQGHTLLSLTKISFGKNKMTWMNESNEGNSIKEFHLKKS